MSPLSTMLIIIDIPFYGSSLSYQFTSCHITQMSADRTANTCCSLW